MRNPKYIEELLKIVFFWLGVAFILVGALCFTGMLKPKAGSSIQDPTIMGIAFSVLGISYFIAQIVLKAIISLKNRLHNELIMSGTKINGTVEKVYMQKYTHYGTKSPYRILYTYTYQGKVRHHKSHLLWEKPDIKEHDSLMVYVNDYGKSTI